MVEKVLRAIEDDPKIAGRLALWARRLMGEALSQAQRVAAERDALSALLVGGVDRPALDLAAIARMFARLTESTPTGWRSSASTPRPLVQRKIVVQTRRSERFPTGLPHGWGGRDQTFALVRPVATAATMTSTIAVSTVTRPWVQSRRRLRRRRRPGR